MTIRRVEQIGLDPERMELRIVGEASSLHGLGMDARQRAAHFRGEGGVDAPLGEFRLPDGKGKELHREDVARGILPQDRRHPCGIDARHKPDPGDLGLGALGWGAPIRLHAQFGKRALHADAPAGKVHGEHIAAHPAAELLHAQHRTETHVPQSGFDVVAHLGQYAHPKRGSQWISRNTASQPRTVRLSMPATTPRMPPIACRSSACTGWTRNSADFEAVAPRIATLGRRVVAIDARGRGKSDNDPQAQRYRPDTYVGDVMRVLDTLNVPRAVFLGTSMGGIMTMLAAVMAPTRVAAAILNDIGPEVDPKGIARIASYVGKSGPFGSWAEMVAAVKTSQGAMFPHGDDAFWRTFAQRVARERDDGGVEFAYDPAIAVAFAAPRDPRPPSMLPLVRSPLPRSGARHPRCCERHPLAEGLATMKRIKPDLQHVEVPDIGHAPTLDEHEAWDALAKFLAQVE